MELRSLAVLLKVAETGSLSQAAVALGMNQSSLSRIVSSSERELGAPVFHRTGRGVTLTEVGESMLPAARQVVVSAEQLVAEVRDRAREPSGLVSIAMMPTVTGAIAEPLFDAMRKAHPGIKLRMLEGFSASIAEWLGDGRVDIGLLSRFGERVPAGEELLASSNMMLVGAAKIPLKVPSVRFRDLAKLPLVLPAPPNGTRMAIDRIARKMGIRLNVLVETDSLEAQRSIVARHECFTVLDPKSIADGFVRGSYDARPISAPRLLRRVVIATTTHRPQTRAARQVVAMLRKMRLLLEAGHQDD